MIFLFFILLLPITIILLLTMYYPTVTIGAAARFLKHIRLVVHSNRAELT